MNGVDDYYHDPLPLSTRRGNVTDELVALGAEVLSDDDPPVAIGLPTLNGGRHLAEALESLVAQRYWNLRILVSDNGSSDDTFAIATDFAKRDRRVYVLRQPETLPAAEHFNLVFRRTSGRYFMWAADDDRWEPGYVRACVDALQATGAVLACTRLDFFGDVDAFYREHHDRFDNPDLSSPAVASRMRALLSRHGWYAIYGLIRRDALEQTRLFRPAFGGDVVLLAELALRGPFTLVDEVLFHYRVAETRPPARSPWHGVGDRVQATPYSHLQEAVADAIASTAGVSRLDKLRAWQGMTAAAAFDRVPLRSWIADEAGTRLRMAAADNDVRSLAKYASLVALGTVRGAGRRVLRPSRCG